jgi:hypothetical protein
MRLFMFVLQHRSHASSETSESRSYEHRGRCILAGLGLHLSCCFRYLPTTHYLPLEGQRRALHA